MITEPIMLTYNPQDGVNAEAGDDIEVLDRGEWVRAIYNGYSAYNPNDIRIDVSPIHSVFSADFPVNVSITKCRHYAQGKRALLTEVERLRAALVQAREAIDYLYRPDLGYSRNEQIDNALAAIEAALDQAHLYKMTTNTMRAIAEGALAGDEQGEQS
jgi:hypothetical protein